MSQWWCSHDTRGEDDMTDRNQRITECTRLDLHTEQRTHTARDNGRNGQQHIMLSGVTAPWRGVRAAADRHVAQPSRVEQLRHSSASYRRIVTWPSSPAARCSYSSRTRRARHGAPARRLEEEAQQAQLPAQRVVALLAAAELEGLRGVGNICGARTHTHR